MTWCFCDCLLMPCNTHEEINMGVSRNTGNQWPASCIYLWLVQNRLNDWYWYMVIFSPDHMTQLPQESIKMNCTSACVSDFSPSRVLSTRIWCNRWAKFNTAKQPISAFYSEQWRITMIAVTVLLICIYRTTFLHPISRLSRRFYHRPRRVKSIFPILRT